MLLDRTLPDADGFEGLLSLQNIDPDLPIIFLTSYQHLPFISEAIMHGAQDYLIKGECNESNMRRSIEFAILRKKYESILIERANFDLLTGVANRGLFENRLELIMSRVQRYGGTFAVALLDLDKFKHINDKYGHAAGDLVLKEVAARLKCAIRQNDLAARLGGDEFALLFEHVKSDDALGSIAKKIIHLFEEPIDILGMKMRISVSFGITFYDETDNLELEDMMMHVDHLMYEAKKIDGNSYCAIQKEGSVDI